MKRYICHKTVEAFKIADIITPVSIGQNGDEERVLYGEGRDDRESVHVNSAYLRKHNPSKGGYYVKYADGYESFSPAEAFESGYSEEGSFNAEFLSDIERIFRDFKMADEQIGEIAKLISRKGA